MINTSTNSQTKISTDTAKEMNTLAHTEKHNKRQAHNLSHRLLNPNTLVKLKRHSGTQRHYISVIFEYSLYPDNASMRDIHAMYVVS